MKVLNSRASRRLLLCLCFALVFCLLSIVYFSRLARKLPKQVRKAIGVIGMYQMRELLYQSRSSSMYHVVLFF